MPKSKYMGNKTQKPKGPKNTSSPGLRTSSGSPSRTRTYKGKKRGSKRKMY